MLQVEYTNQFKRDMKLAKRRGKNLSLLLNILQRIECEKKLELHFRDHALTGNWHLHRELHIESDWLLVYRIIPNEQTVIFTRTGSHSDLFD